jgi:hypothetical protein
MKGMNMRTQFLDGSDLLEGVVDKGHVWVRITLEVFSFGYGGIENRKIGIT